MLLSSQFTHTHKKILCTAWSVKIEQCMTGLIMEKVLMKIIETAGPWNVFRAFKVLRWMYLSINCIVEMVTGYSLMKGPSQAQRRAAEKFEVSAHFMDILGRCNTSPATLSTMDNLILRHSRYGNPNEILG